MSSQWFYVQNGQRIGPAPMEQVKGLLASGVLPKDTLVWHQGLPGWVPAQELPDLTAGAPLPPVPEPPPSAPAAAQAFSPDTGGPMPPRAVHLLKQTRPWVRLMGVLGLIQMGFMTLGGLALLATSLNARVGILPALGAGAAWLLVAGLMLPPALALNHYASRISALERSHHHTELEAALAAQKRFWKYVGILTLVGLGLGLLAIPLAVLVGVGSLALR